jgi:hypothetical protein
MLKKREFERIVRKLELKTRNTGDRHAWFEHEGIVVTRTKRSNQGGDLPFPHAIRQQLKLNESQMRELITCTLTRNDYIEILRQKGLIP